MLKFLAYCRSLPIVALKRAQRIAVAATLVAVLLAPASSEVLAADCTPDQIRTTANWLSAPDTPAAVANNGRAQILGNVANNCDVPVDVEVDVVLQMPLMNVNPQIAALLTSARTVWLEVAPHQKAAFSTDTGLPPDRALDELVLAPRTAMQRAPFGTQQICQNVGASRCLNIEGGLTGEVSLLYQAKLWKSEVQGIDLLRWAADSGVRITRGQTPPGVLGTFSPDSRVVTIDQRLDAYSTRERAAVLAHELQHVMDFASGKDITSQEGCYASEERAYQMEAKVWRAIWSPFGEPAGANSMEDQITGLSHSIENDPEAFIAYMLRSYGNQCSGVQLT
jgi:hypothetical protein